MHHRLVELPLRTATYIDFLQELQQVVESESVALFYDGLSVHTSRKALRFIDQCGWLGMKNVAYCQTDNPMRTILGNVKFKFHQQSLGRFGWIVGAQE